MGTRRLDFVAESCKVVLKLHVAIQEQQNSVVEQSRVQALLVLVLIEQRLAAIAPQAEVLNVFTEKLAELLGDELTEVKSDW